MELKLFPWERGIAPYWVNPENGYEWYIDESCTRWCTTPIQSLKPLKAVCFFVTEKVNGKVNPIERVLIDKKTNEVLAVDTSLESMSSKIEMLRYVL